MQAILWLLQRALAFDLGHYWPFEQQKVYLFSLYNFHLYTPDKMKRKKTITNPKNIYIIVQFKNLFVKDQSLHFAQFSRLFSVKKRWTHSGLDILRAL